MAAWLRRKIVWNHIKSRHANCKNYGWCQYLLKMCKILCKYWAQFLLNNCLTLVINIMTQGNLFIKSTNKTWFSLLSHLFKVVILPSKRRWNAKPPVHICCCCCCCCLSCGVHDEVEDDPDCEGQCQPHTVTWLSSASVSISRMSLSLSLISSSVSSS